MRIYKQQFAYKGYPACFITQANRVLHWPKCLLMCYGAWCIVHPRHARETAVSCANAAQSTVESPHLIYGLGTQLTESE